MGAALLATIIALLVLILISLWAVLYQLIKQQGRILLRQDDLEHRLVHISSLGAAANGLATLGAQPQPQGLAEGTSFPPFRLPDLTGKEVSLEDFHGKWVLLVHWSPQCGFCDLIAPDLARLQAALQERNVQVVLVANGDAEANRKLAEENGLEFPILLQKGVTQTLGAFRNQGTPIAYLLDETWQVARPLAFGADQVSDLAYELAAGGSVTREGASDGVKVDRVASNGSTRRRLPGEKSLSESKLTRDGLKAGIPAPPFSLPDIYGRTVSLEHYRGRRVLLIFSDPHCGPCDQLAPRLVGLHRQHHDIGLAVIMIGRGDPEENRRKAEAHGFEFPVVLQKRWELSKEYGIFATPVAFLIDENGVIARNVAKGLEEILALASDTMANTTT